MPSDRTLKLSPPGLEPFNGSSSTLITTPVGSGLDPRGYYLLNPGLVFPPLISSSSFVPLSVITHLMRNKKNSALAVKFQSLNGTDQITNMEGALHTFVTPIVEAFMFGDYRFGMGHGVVRFPEVEGVDDEPETKGASRNRMVQQARRVIVSAGVQMDFEGKRVMFKVCALSDDPVLGKNLNEEFEILDVETKQINEKRAEYDGLLREHMIYHLTSNHRLPSLSEVAQQMISVSEAVNFLELQTMALDPDYEAICRMYVKLPTQAVLSLEILFNTAIEQLRNEISALEALCPQGYTLTIDPPSIFAQEIGSTLINRIQFVALRLLADGKSAFEHMKVFAFNDYAERNLAVKLLRKALERQAHVQVTNKISLFPGPKNIYLPLEGTEGACLVIHNNSDAFGQNIETEWESGSLDGAIGANSSTAASLIRTRSDLVNSQM